MLCNVKWHYVILECKGSGGKYSEVLGRLGKPFSTSVRISRMQGGTWDLMKVRRIDNHSTRIFGSPRLKPGISRIQMKKVNKTLICPLLMRLKGRIKFQPFL
jgi:hypothetical protein